MDTEKTFEKGDIVGAGRSKRIPDGLETGYHLGVVSKDNKEGFAATIIRIFTHSHNKAKQTIDHSKIEGFTGKQLDGQTYLSDDEFETKTRELRKKGGKYDFDRT